VEKEILDVLIDNGTQHIVITRRKPTKCPECGVEVERDWFISVNGKIVKATDTSTIVEDLNGKMVVLRNEDIRTIEPYQPHFAKNNRSQDRWDP
jgi:hypothetical protein